MRANIKDMSDLFCSRFQANVECSSERFSHIMVDVRNVTKPRIDWDLENKSVIQPLIDMAERMTQV